MLTWWAGLSSLNQAFYVLAVFFTTIFIWQLFSAFGGLGHDVHGDLSGHGQMGSDAAQGGHDYAAGQASHGEAPAGHETPGNHGPAAPAAAHGGAAQSTAVQGDHSGESHTGRPEDTLSTFRLFSIRSILAFGMLFSWAGALYLQRDAFPFLALVRASLWGLLGMVVVALFFWALPRLTEEGTSNLDTAIGQTGQVYLDIPEDGIGQIKVMVSGAVSFVPARSRYRQPLPAGAMVRVVRRLDINTVEVEEIES